VDLHVGGKSHLLNIAQRLSVCGNIRNLYRGKTNVKEREPYFGGNIDGRDKGPHHGIWEMDVPKKEVRIKILHTDKSAMVSLPLL
jgi:hypothetical protein